MDDAGILNQIEQLVEEEHALLNIDDEVRPPDQHARLKAVEVQLDQCWDLLRQRQARREFGEDPDSATVRDADTVEDYLQ